MRGFSVHGVTFHDVNSTQGIGDCPFCGKNNHFFVNHQTKLWDCKVCNTFGNFNQFLTLISKKNQENLTGKILLNLVKDRSIDAITLRKWGVGWNGNSYTIPVQGNQELCDLRLYKIGNKTRSSPGGVSNLIGSERISEDHKKPIIILEGEWDGMIIDRVTRAIKENFDVTATPGANIFKSDWQSYFIDRDVIIGYDNDKAGADGIERVIKMLTGIARSIKYIHWPESFPSGFDVRDLWNRIKKPLPFFETFMSMVSDAPKILSSKEPEIKQEELAGDGMPVQEVMKAYKKWMHLPDIEPLYVLFGTIFANRLPGGGDPLWLFLIAPSGGSKSEFLMSLSDAPLIRAITSLTPHSLVSGATFAGGKDPSLIPQLDEKVLVIKDFTAILSMNSTARDEILGILRDAYDGKVAKVFGTGITRSYSVSFGFLAGTTPAIEMFNTIHATLGERFLKYRIKFKKESEEELIAKALSNISHENEMRNGLRDVGKQVLSRPVLHTPEMSEPMKLKISLLARWIANLRGVVSREKYTREVQFKPTKEVATRLAKQLAKLALGISIFKQEDKVSWHTFNIVKNVTRDTVPDRVEEIIKVMYYEGAELNTSEIARRTRFPNNTCSNVLQDLNLLGAIQRAEGVGPAQNWVLNEKLVIITNKLEMYQKRKGK